MIAEMRWLLDEAENFSYDDEHEKVLDLCNQAFAIYKNARDKRYNSVKGQTCHKLLLQIATYVYTICEEGDAWGDVIVPRTELTLFTDVAVALSMSTQELQNHLIASEDDIEL